MGYGDLERWSYDSEGHGTGDVRRGLWISDCEHGEESA